VIRTSTASSPSFRLVQAHFGLGLVGMVGFAAALVFRAPWLAGHHFQAATLGLVHLAVLGWLMPVALGALLQLAPVLFEGKTGPAAPAWIAWGLYTLGAWGMIAHFFALKFGPGMIASGSMALAAFAIHGALLGRTMARGNSFGLTGAFLASAIFHLLVAATIGLVLAWNLWRPFLPKNHLVVLQGHAHAAGLGFFGLLVMGVGDRLLEMFLVSHGASQTPARIALVATNAAVLALTVSYVFGPWTWLTDAGAALAAVGVAAFLVRVAGIRRKRIRRRLDVSLGYSLVALGYLGVAAAGGATLALFDLPTEWAERLAHAYGLIALIGFLGTLVIGQLGKILPFLVWLHRFEPFAGRKKIPLASDLLPEAPQRWAFRALNAGLPILAVGVAVDLAAVRIAGATLFAAGVFLAAKNFHVVCRSQP
jgi:hypothetical protein